MSVGEMDEYVRQRSPADAMELESQTQVQNDHVNDDNLADATASVSSLSTARDTTSARPASTPTHVDPPTLSQVQPPHDNICPTFESLPDSLHTTFAPSQLDEDTSPPPIDMHDNTSSSGIKPNDTSAHIDSHSQAIPSTMAPPQRELKAPKETLKSPSTLTNPLRVDVRWAPKDFKLVKSSSAILYARLAPIISGFNTTHSWVVEWQTDQLAKTHTIDPIHLAQFLSIRKVTSVKQQCFYLSFRVDATGSQFIQVLKSKAMQALKKGESISFDTSQIPHTQGEATNIGDILLKDAKITHRSNYLKYLRAEVLPPETPAFD